MMGPLECDAFQHRTRAGTQREVDGQTVLAEDTLGTAGRQRFHLHRGREPVAFKHINHDDRDGARRLLGGANRWDAAGHEAVDLELDQLGGKRRITLQFASRKARLDDEILSFRIAKFPEALFECLVFSAIPDATP
jgi:hypothetical protein